MDEMTIRILSMIFGMIIFSICYYFRCKYIEFYLQYDYKFWYFISGIIWIIAFYFIAASFFTSGEALGGFLVALVLFTTIYDNNESRSGAGIFTFIGELIAIVFLSFFGAFVYSYITQTNLWIVEWDIARFCFGVLIIATAILSLLEIKFNDEILAEIALILIFLISAIYLVAISQYIGTYLLEILTGKEKN